jgi:hypothetical protein
MSFRETQQLIADSLNEPVFHVKTERGEWYGGWQAFADWLVIERPARIEITVSEWEDLSDLMEAAE